MPHARTARTSTQQVSVDPHSTDRQHKPAASKSAAGSLQYRSINTPQKNTTGRRKLGKPGASKEHASIPSKAASSTHPTGMLRLTDNTTQMDHCNMQCQQGRHNQPPHGNGGKQTAGKSRHSVTCQLLALLLQAAAGTHASHMQVPASSCSSTDPVAVPTHPSTARRHHSFRVHKQDWDPGTEHNQTLIAHKLNLALKW